MKCPPLAALFFALCIGSMLAPPAPAQGKGGMGMMPGGGCKQMMQPSQFGAMQSPMMMNTGLQNPYMQKTGFQNPMMGNTSFQNPMMQNAAMQNLMMQRAALQYQYLMMQNAGSQSAFMPVSSLQNPFSPSVAQAGGFRSFGK